MPSDDNDRPDYAVPFPGAKIGDLLYSCENYGLEAEPETLVVVSIDSEGYIRVVPAGSKGDRVFLQWGCEFDKSTPDEAARHQARIDQAYYRKRLQRADELIESQNAGQDWREIIGEIKDS